MSKDPDKKARKAVKRATKAVRRAARDADDRVFPDALKMALGVHETMRTMGIAPERIFVQTYGDPLSPDLAVVLGPIGFPVGNVGVPVAVFPMLWKAAVTWWNHDATDEERRDLFHHFTSRTDGARLVALVQQADALASLPEN